MERIVTKGKFTGLTFKELMDKRNIIEDIWIKANDKYSNKIDEIDEAIGSIGEV
jgi:hypothetical protein